jgi:hypothetical protein
MLFFVFVLFFLARDPLRKSLIPEFDESGAWPAIVCVHVILVVFGRIKLARNLVDKEWLQEK